MLGLLLLYFIGKRFYDLSVDYKQNKWLYATLSIVVYYAGGLFFVLLIAFLDAYIFEWGFDWESSYGMNLLVIPFGLIVVWVFYMLLENRWKKNIVVIKDEIQDIGKPLE